MDSRERVLAAVAHREPDRVPFDLGGTVVTGIHVVAYRALRQHLELPATDVVVLDPMQQLALVDDDVRDLLGADVGFVGTRQPMGGLPTDEDAEYRYLRDEFGIVWHMPKDGGLYYDMHVSPLSGEVSLDDVGRFPMPDTADPGLLVGMREACLHVRDVERRAVAIWSYSAGPFELAGWLRGAEGFFMDLAAEPAVAGRLMDRIVEMKVRYLEKALAEVGDVVDLVCVGDDLGGQATPLVDPDMYRSLVKPRQRELLAFIHARTPAKVFFHCCGAIRPLIPDLIEIGVDILNPVQVSARGMDPAELKREYGRDLVFWGGGVDTQRVLGSGTPGQVRDEVRRRLDDFMPGGGYVFNPVHNIQSDVPPENIMAMWEAVRKFGVYSS